MPQVVVLTQKLSFKAFEIEGLRKQQKEMRERELIRNQLYGKKDWIKGSQAKTKGKLEQELY